MDFKPPPPLTDYDIKNWTLWKQKFNIYLKASDKEKCKDDMKIAILLNCIGDDGLDVYNTFENEQKSTLEKLLEAFDNYFLPKKIIPMETFKFNNLVQTEFQTIEQYLTELKKQAKLCDFVCKNPECKTPYDDRMIRDRLIVGIHDKQVQARLIRESDIDVSKIVEYYKSVKLSKEHLKTLSPEEDVNAVSKFSRKITCPKCLYEHFENRCPAFNKTCVICQERGHFAKACPQNEKTIINPHNTVDSGNRNPSKSSKREKKDTMQVRELLHVESESEFESDGERRDLDEELFVNECVQGNVGSWSENIVVDDVQVTFKLDSGSDCSILPKHIFQKLPNKSHLKSCAITLVSYGNFRFKPLGEIVLSCQYKSMIRNIKFVVVDCHTEPLLGLVDCLQFGLISRVNVVNLLKTKDEIFECYKDIFDGLGRIPGLCTIKLADNAKPVIQCQRKVPFGLRDRLKSTLDSLEKKRSFKKLTIQLSG